MSQQIKQNEIIKCTQSKNDRKKKEKGNKDQMVQMENKWQYGKFKANHTSNHVKCKWSQHLIEKQRSLSWRRKQQLTVCYKKHTLNIKK